MFVQIIHLNGCGPTPANCKSHLSANSKIKPDTNLFIEADVEVSFVSYHSYVSFLQFFLIFKLYYYLRWFRITGIGWLSWQENESLWKSKDLNEKEISKTYFFNYKRRQWNDDLSFASFASQRIRPDAY